LNFSQVDSGSGSIGIGKCGSRVYIYQLIKVKWTSTARKADGTNNGSKPTDIDTNTPIHPYWKLK
jgi:hypothetical protein